MQKSNLSVIISNYNHACYLPMALDAILAQSYQPKEVLIVDDASTDNSLEMIESYAAKFDVIKVIRNEKNQGAVMNINRQLKCATGEYVYTAGADDKVLPGFFQKTMDLLTRHPQAGLCSGLSLRMNMKAENAGLDYLPIVSRRPAHFSPDQCKGMIGKYYNWIHSTATIYRRDALLAAGGFIPELHSYCDVFAGFVIALKYGVCYIPEPLAAFRITHSNYRSIFEREPQVLFEVKDCVKRLIDSSHASLFPDDFMEEVERAAVYNYNRLRLSSVHASAERSKKLNELKSPLARLLYGIVHPSGSAENIVSNLYLFLHSGRKIYDPFLRKVLKYSHPLVTRKCRQVKI